MSFYICVALAHIGLASGPPVYISCCEVMIGSMRLHDLAPPWMLHLQRAQIVALTICTEPQPTKIRAADTEPTCPPFT